MAEDCYVLAVEVQHQATREKSALRLREEIARHLAFFARSQREGILFGDPALLALQVRQMVQAVIDAHLEADPRLSDELVGLVIDDLRACTPAIVRQSLADLVPPLLTWD